MSAPLSAGPVDPRLGGGYRYMGGHMEEDDVAGLELEHFAESVRAEEWDLWQCGSCMCWDSSSSFWRLHFSFGIGSRAP